MDDDRDLGTQAGEGEESRGPEPSASVLTADPNGVSAAGLLPGSSPWEHFPATLSRPTDPPPVPMVELSKSDRQFIAAYAAGGGLAAVGRRWIKLRGKKPYSTTEAASNSASRKLCEIRKRFAESGHPELFWESLGLDASTLARVLTEAFDADRFEPAMVRRDRVITLENGDQKIVRDDDVRIVRVGPDHRTRVDAASKAASLRGELYSSRRHAADSEEPQGSRVNVFIRSFAGVVNNTQFNQPAALSAEQPKEE